MTVLHQTRLSLVVLLDTDNDPIAAGGLLMGVAGRLARAFDRRNPQVFKIKLPQVSAGTAWAEIERISHVERVDAKALFARERLPFSAFTPTTAQSPPTRRPWAAP
jgi:hypothetical protein